MRLLGQAGSRQYLSTPALILDLDAFEANVAAMASWARETGIGLRPHAKTHKSSRIAKALIAAGAKGSSVATISEAEAFVDAGVGGVLITSTLVTGDKIARLVALNDRARDLMVIADDPGNVEKLAGAASAAKPLNVMIDVEVGSGRTGVVGTASVINLIERVNSYPSLRFAGLQAYNGSVQAIPGHSDRAAKLDADLTPLRELLAALSARGVKPPIVSGGGTGTHQLDAKSGLFTELQPGSYIVMDRIYGACDLRGSGLGTFRHSLFVRTSVISTAKPGYVTTDAGLKAFSTDSGAPVIATGAPQGATYSFKGDEHGRISFAEPGQSMAIGHQVECVPPHCDPTVNLYDCYHVVRGDTLVDIWPIDGRGHW
jgi:D-serine deaminase-like pyridoxal phosphate-dependent protein